MKEVQLLRILAVDDDRSTLRIFDAVARNTGCQIRVCTAQKQLKLPKNFNRI